MAKFRVRPREVEAHQHQRGVALPEPFASHKDTGAYGAQTGIGKGAVGELLVPKGGQYTAAQEGDWLVMAVDGSVSVLKDRIFREVYEPLDAPDAPGTASGESAADQPAVEKAESEG